MRECESSDDDPIEMTKLLKEIDKRSNASRAAFEADAQKKLKFAKTVDALQDEQHVQSRKRALLDMLDDTRYDDDVVE